MNDQQSLNHSVWNCKYHIVWIPKYRKKSLYKELRQYVGPILKDLAMQRECKIEDGHLMSARRPQNRPVKYVEIVRETSPLGDT